MKSFPSKLVREWAWRAGRKLYCYARKEPANNPVINGEYWLFSQYVNHVQDIDTILDIGANMGEWTQNVVDTLHSYEKQAAIHAFEPTRAAFAFLEKKFSACPDVHLINAAATNQSGSLDIYVVSPCAGTNSLYPEPGAKPEHVSAVTVDDYCNRHSISRVGYVKCDVEGFDMNVIRGANETLKNGRCDVWQFEYNIRWVNNRSFIRDVFEYIEDKPYKFGKLYGNGVDIYERWHPELERYFECNCVLIKNGSFLDKVARRVAFTKSNAARYE